MFGLAFNGLEYIILTVNRDISIYTYPTIVSDKFSVDKFWGGDETILTHWNARLENYKHIILLPKVIYNSFRIEIDFRNEHKKPKQYKNKNGCDLARWKMFNAFSVLSACKSCN